MICLFVFFFIFIFLKNAKQQKANWIIVSEQRRIQITNFFLNEYLTAKFRKCAEAFSTSI